MDARDKGALQKAISLVSSCFLLLALTSMDFLSFGARLLETRNYKESTECISLVLFVYPTIASQVIFGLATGLNSGVCAGAIFEARQSTCDMSRECEKHTSTLGELVLNTYLSIFASTMLFSFVSYLLYRYRIGKMLQQIPLAALYGVMGSIVYASLRAGVEEVYKDGDCSKPHLNLCMAVSVIQGLVLYLLELRLSSFVLLIPSFSIGILALFHLGMFALGKDMARLRAMGLVPAADAVSMDITSLTRHLTPANLKFDALAANWRRMVELALFNLVHLTVNVSGFAEATGVKSDLNQELKAQSIGNLVSAFLGYPTYFICSTSIYFHRSGGRTRIHSLAGALSLLLLVFFGSAIRSILPITLLATLPLFIGFSFFRSYVYLPMRRMSLMDSAILLVSMGVSILLSPSLGLFFGIFLSSVYFIYIYSKRLLSGRIRSEGPAQELGVEGHKDSLPRTMEIGGVVYRIVKIDYAVFFGTIERFRHDVAGFESNVLFDLRDCLYFDTLANFSLEEAVGRLSARGYRVCIIGEPHNLYRWMYAHHILNGTSP
jgi:sulfate permease, SulP family